MTTSDPKYPLKFFMVTLPLYKDQAELVNARETEKMIIVKQRDNEIRFKKMDYKAIDDPVSECLYGSYRARRQLYLPESQLAKSFVQKRINRLRNDKILNFIHDLAQNTPESPLLGQIAEILKDKL